MKLTRKLKKFLRELRSPGPGPDLEPTQTQKDEITEASGKQKWHF